MLQPLSARQPKQEAWPIERLLREHAVALGHALESSTISAYDSHLQSYLSFCENHNFPIQPTIDTLSFYIIYMCHHVKPSTAGNYLSGICHLLKPYYPDKLCGLQPTNHKCALTHEDLCSIISSLTMNPSYDDRLFIAMLLTGFFGLLRLGEITFPDNPRKCSFKKVIMHHTLSVEPTHFAFTLPYHKADCDDIAGHSLCSGGAMALALADVADNAIQAMGHWSSDTWHIYICKHPVLLQAIMHGHSAFQTQSPSAYTALSSHPFPPRI
ncbi:hypothetical protein M422DRAFT_159981 [Sphaerobolus stellatus SS14]|nr:hypothetical protein M422DRAFT_159981 [Sphaerobolus stellatus SS14]